MYMTIFSKPLPLSGMRIWAIMLRHLIQIYKDPIFLLQVFFSVTLNIVLWGFASKWLEATYIHNVNVQLTMVVLVVAWESTVRACFDISCRLLDDVLDCNFVNVMASPLQLLEYLLGLMGVACVNQCTVLLIAFCIARLCYNVALWQVNFAVLPFVLSMLLTGLSLGLCGASILLAAGRGVMGVVFALGRTCAPFSGAFYPITV
jgi:ABC-2 type transport system permease protein